MTWIIKKTTKKHHLLEPLTPIFGYKELQLQIMEKMRPGRVVAQLVRVSS